MVYMHYCLGFPPYRTGGMTKFCFDIANYQAESNKVYILRPGRYSLLNKKVKIKITKIDKLYSAEIINPLPVPLCNGIKDIDLFTENKNCFDKFKNLFKTLKIEILHIHTFMGMPKDLLKAAKDCDIKILYTTHDYFGICPTTHLFYNGELCKGDIKYCEICCQNAFSKNKIFIMQSKLYKKLKNTKLITRFRQRYRGDNEKISMENYEIKKLDYNKLKLFYLDMFNYVDYIHCNSTVSFRVFEKNIGREKLFIQNITHRNVNDNRIFRKRNTENKIKFLFLGPEVASKGFHKIIDVLDQLYYKYKNFELIVYSRDHLFEDRDYLKNYGTYEYSELFRIMNSADMLLAPSLWYETFGFVVLEAYYCGLPSLVTTNVGAKDIITNNYTGVVCDVDEISETLEKILKKPSMLITFSENIQQTNLSYNFDSMATNIYKCLK